MLILTRRVGEVLRIGDDIKVTVIGKHANNLRIGIDAPLDVEVHRSEIYYRIHPDRKPIEKDVTELQSFTETKPPSNPTITVKKRKKVNVPTTTPNNNTD